MARRRRRGQALVELAVVMPLLLLILLGGMSVGLLILNRMTLTHAAQESAVAGAEQGGCSSALGVVPRVLGREPYSKDCVVRGQLVEVTLTERTSQIAPMLPMPEVVTVSARAAIREPEPSPSPSPSPSP